MKVAVTGASGQVGTLLGERLDGRAEVVPLGREDDWRAGMAGADALVHLAGTLQPRRGESYESANVETAARAAAAVVGTEVDRIVFLSYVGARPDSPNAYLRTKAEAERVLIETGVPTTVFRCLHICGPPERPGPTAAAFLATGGKPVSVVGSGRQRIAPLFVGDAVEAVLAATLCAEPAAGVFELGGPDEMSVDELVRTLNGADVRIRHIPAVLARLVGRVSSDLTPVLIDLLLRDSVAAAPPEAIAARFGFVPTRIGDVWARP
ncbi:MAG: NAD-dependent epimerase/dehydratase family protein [Solirubrobacterales bacterium]